MIEGEPKKREEESDVSEHRQIVLLIEGSRGPLPDLRNTAGLELSEVLITDHVTVSVL